MKRSLSHNNVDDDDDDDDNDSKLLINNLVHKDSDITCLQVAEKIRGTRHQGRVLAEPVVTETYDVRSNTCLLNLVSSTDKGLLRDNMVST
jgi:hypothetical protein